MSSEADLENARQMRDHLQRRVALWLALGNGAGVVATASKLADQIDKTIAYVLFPSVWAFSIGLLAAGAANWALLVHFVKIANPGQGSDRVIEPEEVILFLCLAISPISFTVGLLYPTVVLSIRYLSHGVLS